MSELQRFLPQDQELLVGLFYRVGIWMSSVDDTDIGTKSEEQEAAKLSQVLTSLGNNKKSLLVADLAQEALRQTQSHERWAGHTDTVLDDIMTAKTLLKGQCTADETNSFCRSMMLIATAVARAVREDADAEDEKSYLGWLTSKANELSLAIKDRDSYKDMNVSPAEDSALTELYDALKS